LSELHLFIVWQNAYQHKERIIADLAKRFVLHRVTEITWSETHFSDNMSRFYGEKLPFDSYKEKHCGRGPFTLITFTDRFPNYALRETSRGTERVNVNIFDLKTVYREWTGGGHLIHATNSPAETKHDLMLLLGCTTNDYSLNVSHDGAQPGQRGAIRRDVIGSEGWASLSELFYVLNATMEYVVLRNFENLPNLLPGHDDIDLLVRSANGAAYITNAINTFPNESKRVHYRVRVAGNDVPFDFRYVGDNYMPRSMCEKILQNKIMDSRGFYRPSDKDYFWSLLYHGLVHKPSLSDDYKTRLCHLAETSDIDIAEGTLKDAAACWAILTREMERREIDFSRPDDPSVGFHLPHPTQHPCCV
jgi:hypothetical protein